MQTLEEREAALAPQMPARQDAAVSAEETMVTLDDGTILTFAERRTFGGMEQTMARKPIPGFHLHWVNDDPGRIGEFRQAGYTQVLLASGQPDAIVVDKQTGKKAYLHKVPLPWYKADMAAQQKLPDEKERAIQTGNAPSEDGSAPGLESGKTYGKVTLSRKSSG